MISRNLFFSNFQINYFDYKQGSLRFLLDNYSKVGLDKSILEYKDKDYITAIKSDIRQTYFQAIETVFEVFFALLPDKKRKFTNRVIEKITLSELPYLKIKDIAQNQNSLDFLDSELRFPGNEVLTLGEYVFYYGLNKREDLRTDFLKSLEAIKYALWILANEFSDRKEYNSYKHGLRIFPALQKFAICETGTMKEQLSFDLDGSMTFFSFDNKTKEVTYTTKLFDSERDIRMTSICSALIWNMIKFRDVVFNKEKKDKDYQFAILIFEKEQIAEATKTDVSIQNFKYSIKPENN